MKWFWSSRSTLFCPDAESARPLSRRRPDATYPLTIIMNGIERAIENMIERKQANERSGGEGDEYALAGFASQAQVTRSIHY